MPLTISSAAGDNTWLASIGLPDSGTAVTLAGSCNPSGLDGSTDVAMSPTSLTAPTPPGSGSIYWIIEANLTTGAVDIQQSTVSMPTGSGAGYQTIFQQTLTPATTDPSENGSDVTPDS